MKKKAIIAKAAIVSTTVVGIVLVLHVEGTFGGQRATLEAVPPPAVARAIAARSATVERRDVEDHVEWAGTVRSRTLAQVASKVMARVLEVGVTVGATVRRGDLLAVLDDRDLRARVDQARSALTSAEAQAVQAESDHERVRALFPKGAATKRDLEAALARARSLRAQVAQARDAALEAEVLLGEARVLAPFDGVISERHVEPGNVAVPGRPILAIQDPARLRLEVEVPEMCAGAVTLGGEVRVRVETLALELSARLEEIDPAADPRTRTFLVKAALPETPGLRSGMFGRFIQPCGRRAALLLPREAVSRVGQLETVSVLEPDGAWRPRHVRTGKLFGERVEVLSGLAAGEIVVLP